MEGGVVETRYPLFAYPLLKPVKGRSLAVWILAAKLPHSDLDFAVDFGVD